MDAFAVPRRLFTGHKRRAEAPRDDNFTFFTADDFNMFSIRGDSHESRLYGELETCRRTLVTTTSGLSNRPQNSSSFIKIKEESKHLVQLLVELVETNRIQAPKKRVELDNAYRRISGFSVAEQERYMMLQRKVFQAQQVQEM